MPSWTRERIAPVVAALVVLPSGLVAREVLSGWLANGVGVALWSVLIACLVVFVRPRTAPVAVFGVTLAISVAVELFQLTGIPLQLARIHRLWALVLGSTFQWADLPAYAVGAALGGLGAAIRGAPTVDPTPPPPNTG